METQQGWPCTPTAVSQALNQSSGASLIQTVPPPLKKTELTPDSVSVNCARGYKRSRDPLIAAKVGSSQRNDTTRSPRRGGRYPDTPSLIDLMSGTAG